MSVTKLETPTPATPEQLKFKALVSIALEDSTQSELADKLNVNAQTVWRWANDRGYPTKSAMAGFTKKLEEFKSDREKLSAPAGDWLLSRSDLLRRYDKAEEIWVAKSGRGLLSKDNDEAKEVFRRMVLENLAREALDSKASYRTINFLVVNKDSANLMKKEVFAQQKIILNDDTKTPEEQLEEIGQLYKLIPDNFLTFTDALDVKETIIAYVRNENLNIEQKILDAAINKTVRIYKFSSVFELWAFGLSGADFGWIYLEYKKAPTDLSPLTDELFLEMDVQVLRARDEFSRGAATRWIRPADQVIGDRVQRIKTVIHRAVVSGPVDAEV